MKTTAEGTIRLTVDQLADLMIKVAAKVCEETGKPMSYFAQDREAILRDLVNEPDVAVFFNTFIEVSTAELVAKL